MEDIAAALNDYSDDDFNCQFQELFAPLQQCGYLCDQIMPEELEANWHPCLAEDQQKGFIDLDFQNVFHQPQSCEENNWTGQTYYPENNGNPWNLDNASGLMPFQTNAELPQFEQPQMMIPSPQLSECSFISNSKGGNTWKSNEGRKPKTYYCGACNRWFASSATLKQHYKSYLHQNATKQRGEIGLEAATINSHHYLNPQRDQLRLQPQQEDLQPIIYKCLECNKIFNKVCYLIQHSKTYHSGPKPFRCASCGKRFTEEYQYQQHLKKHVDEKPYKCLVCPKEFNYNIDLRRHMYMHTGNKPFACEYCKKGFVRKDHMLKHAKTHKKKMSKSLFDQQMELSSLDLILRDLFQEAI